MRTKTGNNQTRLELYAACIIICLFQTACGRHSSDAELLRVFRRHEASFHDLLKMVQSDTQIVTMTPSVLITRTKRLQAENPDISDIRSAGLSKERWMRYQTLFRNLGLKGGVLRGDGGSFCFKADTESVWNGDTSKGYVYSDATVEPRVPDLDRYRPLGDTVGRHRPYIAYRQIEPHWYLYFCRN